MENEDRASKPKGIKASAGNKIPLRTSRLKVMSMFRQCPGSSCVFFNIIFSVF